MSEEELKNGQNEESLNKDNTDENQPSLRMRHRIPRGEKIVPKRENSYHYEERRNYGRDNQYERRPYYSRPSNNYERQDYHRRTYNNGVFSNYHTGIDFGVCTANNINIYAAANGTVLFAQELPIHGNFTVINHGWGVYTSYSHQSQLLVTAGQEVNRGDLIGLIGNTGRSVGPHLHWEVIVNSTYVNPVTWLGTQFP